MNFSLLIGISSLFLHRTKMNQIMKSKKTHLLIQFIILAVLLFGNECVFSQSGNIKTNIVNGVNFLDTQGKVINAHGGGFLKVGNFYYWIGENRHDDVLVSCYR